jgi:hypothetical protein
MVTNVLAEHATPIFRVENTGNMFFWNADNHLEDYTIL